MKLTTLLSSVALSYITTSTTALQCKDHTAFRFKVKNKKKQTTGNKRCKWLNKNNKRRNQYCKKNWQKRAVRAACPKSCHVCPKPPPPTTAPIQPPTQPPAPRVDPWSFLVVADWHASEFFATNPDKESGYYKEVQDEIDYIRNAYGGDLVVMPGDVNGALPGEAGGGKWDRDIFAEIFRPGLNVNQRIRAAGRNCYGAVRDLFSEAGYEPLLVALGDHEIGGNSWGEQNLRKLDALPTFHSTFTEGFNENPDTSEFLFQKPIGAVPSSPQGTKFEGSSFAYEHKNVLFITLDGFRQLPNAFIDREQGYGGEGVITCTVDGEHLKWFEKILRAGSRDNSIRHIIVQAHLPIIQPVRKVACSGQFLDGGEKSALWKLMVKYGVDIYFAGEVHANTATQDPKSKLIQIVSRGNQFNNFLKIDVTHHALNVIAYNELGTKRMNNHNHTVHGSLLIDKSACAPPSAAPSESPSMHPTDVPSTHPTDVPSTHPTVAHSTNPTAVHSTHPTSVPLTEKSSQRLIRDPVPDNERIITGCADTAISSTGVLRLLDRASALIHFDFETILPLGNRQVIGLQHDDHRETLVAKSITIRGTKSEESLPNLGSFDKPYDAQVSNVSIFGPSNVDTIGTELNTAPHGAQTPKGDKVERKPARGNYYAHFITESRFGIFGNGPHTPGIGISFALWVNYDLKKRNKKLEMILVHYGHTFSVTDQTKKDILTLTVGGDGTLKLYTSPTSVLQSKLSYNFAHEWHHIAVSMPRSSCELSEVVIYVDGKPIPTVEPRKDKSIFFISSGKVSIGGFGHSNENFESLYPHLIGYRGAVDDFYLWSRPLEDEDFLEMGVNSALLDSDKK